MNKTIDYYNKNTNSFIENTVEVDFSANQNRFLELLDEHARILDFGCGSGRDTKYFLDHGMEVEAIDGSKQLCKSASEYTGITVKHMYFEELNCEEYYDGIWACASILHVPKRDLSGIFVRMCNALKTGGILYCSFKYGDFEGERNGRYFSDMTVGSINTILSRIPQLHTEATWITGDVRQGREEEQWLNLILRKR